MNACFEAWEGDVRCFLTEFGPFVISKTRENIFLGGEKNYKSSIRLEVVLLCVQKSGKMGLVPSQQTERSSEERTGRMRDFLHDIPETEFFFLVLFAKKG